MIRFVATAEEARAAHAGTLTEIRRPVDPQPACNCRYEMNGNRDKALHLATAVDGSMLFVPVRGDAVDHRVPCPLGAPGDLLFVDGATLCNLGVSVERCGDVWTWVVQVKTVMRDGEPVRPAEAGR